MSLVKRINHLSLFQNRTFYPLASPPLAERDHKSIDRSMRNVQKTSLPYSSYGLGAISDKLIFTKNVFVGNRALGPAYEQNIQFC